MKFNFRFSNLLGTVYRRGNLTFSPDGNSVVSPVGNRITLFDLKNNKSETLPAATRVNISCVGLSRDMSLAILIDEEGAAVLVSMISKSVLHHFHFHKPVHSIKFSPDGRKFVVTKDKVAMLYHAPGLVREFNPFVLDKTFFGPYDETTCIDWTDDSRCFSVGSKDMSTWVFGVERWQNLVFYALGGHRDAIVACFFRQNSLDIYTLSRDAALCVWECDTPLTGLRPRVAKAPEAAAEKEEEEVPCGEGDGEGEKAGEVIHGKVETEVAQYKVHYKQKFKHFFNKDGDFNCLTAADYHKATQILVSAFASGVFHIHELPDFNLIHSLSISDQSISSVCINNTGDWIAFGCTGYGQLLVWEWQSESYVMKQQGHYNSMACVSYSPDGQHMATGGDDGKVKLWNTSSGFCFVTFSDHSSSITGVTFTSTGFVVLSASLDGTVRAFDLHRYRNFRTFTSPRPAQFCSVAVDSSGEVVCAGSSDHFEVYVWSMQTGRLLEVLAGHEGPVSGLSFSPGQALLASCSWDRTVRVWDVFENKGNRETIQLNSDALAVVFRPDGKQIAVATLDGHISFWDPHQATQTGSIEGRHDLAMGRRDLDLVTAKHTAKGKSFTTLCYSADGECILAGGRSKFVCIYNIQEQILIKKFEISCNHSLDAMEQFLDRRKMTEFGSLALIDEGVGDEEGTAISLPGVRRGDMSSRHFKPEVRVTSLQFAPTGQGWAATTTEGLLVYSLDRGLVFDPFDLDVDVTPQSVRKALSAGNFSTALILSFRLNEKQVIQEVLESIPHSHIEIVSRSLAEVYVLKTLDFVAVMLESSCHLHFYLLWAHQLLLLHGPSLKARSASILPLIRNLQRSTQKRHDEVAKLCDWNMYNMRYVLALAQQTPEKPDGGVAEEDLDENELLSDLMI